MTALLGAPGLIPRTHVAANSCLKLQFQRVGHLFSGFLRSCMHLVHRHTHRQNSHAHPHKIKINLEKKERSRRNQVSMLYICLPSTWEVEQEVWGFKFILSYVVSSRPALNRTTLDLSQKEKNPWATEMAY